ncbi:MAG: 30S ribosomal protein S5 [Patescibacteria group bacterium]
MTDDIATKTAPAEAPAKRPAARPTDRGQKSGGSGAQRGGGAGGRGGNGRPRGNKPQQQVREYEQKILDLARVTRVTAGGKRMSFRCALIIGDKKGKVGLGVAKGIDVQIAVEKAYRQAKKNIITVPMYRDTIPHAVSLKYGSAMILIKPAPKGTGLKSGGAVRLVFEYAGVPNVVSRVLNSSNKINIARAALEAIQQLKVPKKKEVVITKQPEVVE